MAVERLQENLLQKEITEFLEQKQEIKDLYLFTVNHKTAPVPIREKFSIPDYALTEANQNLQSFKSLKSFMILSTCNRTEIYFKTDNMEKALSDIYNFFSKHLGLEQNIANEYNNILRQDAVIQHAFKVSSGLESLVLGESQVLSQVKNAYSVAQKEKTLDFVLETLFQNTIKTSKEIHKNTNLSRNCQSISSAAIDLASKICGPLKTKSIMVLGAGQMAKLSLEHILKLGGSKETVVLNRSPHRVIEFSEKYKIDKSIAFENVYEAMNDVDIVIAATGAPHFIIFAEQFKILRKDPKKPLFILDISMPRNIDSEFGNLENVKLMDIDSLQVIYNESINIQNEDITNAKKIISSGIKEFYSQIAEQKVSSLVKDLKEKIEQIRNDKLSQLKNTQITFTSEELDYITKNIINTIFHTPIKTLKNSSRGGSQDEKLQILRDLFEL